MQRINFAKQPVSKHSAVHTSADYIVYVQRLRSRPHVFRQRIPG